MANLSMGADTQTTQDTLSMGSDIDMAEYDEIASSHNKKKGNDQTMETLEKVGKVALTAAVLL